MGKQLTCGIAQCEKERHHRGPVCIGIERAIVRKDDSDDLRMEI